MESIGGVPPAMGATTDVGTVVKFVARIMSMDMPPVPPYNMPLHQFSDASPSPPTLAAYIHVPSGPAPSLEKFPSQHRVYSLPDIPSEQEILYSGLIQTCENYGILYQDSLGALKSTRLRIGDRYVFALKLHRITAGVIISDATRMTPYFFDMTKSLRSEFTTFRNDAIMAILLRFQLNVADDLLCNFIVKKTGPPASPIAFPSSAVDPLALPPGPFFATQPSSTPSELNRLPADQQSFQVAVTRSHVSTPTPAPPPPGGDESATSSVASSRSPSPYHPLQDVRLKTRRVEELEAQLKQLQDQIALAQSPIVPKAEPQPSSSSPLSSTPVESPTMIIDTTPADAPRKSPLLSKGKKKRSKKGKEKRVRDSSITSIGSSCSKTLTSTLIDFVNNPEYSLFVPPSLLAADDSSVPAGDVGDPSSTAAAEQMDIETQLAVDLISTSD